MGNWVCANGICIIKGGGVCDQQFRPPMCSEFSFVLDVAIKTANGGGPGSIGFCEGKGFGPLPDVCVQPYIPSPADFTAPAPVPPCMPFNS